jgi:hypothetical protein
MVDGNQIKPSKTTTHRFLMVFFFGAPKRMSTENVLKYLESRFSGQAFVILSIFISRQPSA